MQNLLDILESNVGLTPEKIALRSMRAGQWVEWSWKGVDNDVKALSQYLIDIGHKSGNSVALMSCNLPEWTISDFAVLALNGVVVPIYTTSTKEQTEYILRDSDARILIVGQHEQAKVALELKADGVVDHVIGLDSVNLSSHLSTSELSEIALYDSVVEKYANSYIDMAEMYRRRGATCRDSLATLIYTSGTTGEPKGVMLSHGNFLSQFKNHDLHLGAKIKLDSLALLPLSHVFERAWTFYVLYRGGRNTYLDNPNSLQKALSWFSPTVMCAVPRVYEKMYTTICNKVMVAPKHKRLLFKWALDVGSSWAKSKQSTGVESKWLSFKHKLASFLVLSKIKKKLFPMAEMLPCSGAKLSDEVNLFFQSIGLPIAYGYGMTETTATISCYTSSEMELGTVGSILSGVEVKLSNDGNNEILVKGDTVMKGYFNKPEATDEVFTDDGWFKTGDAGALVDGKVVLTERIKELMKTSNGKYIAPQQVEGALIQEPLFEQVAVVADCKKFVSALIVPAYDSLEQCARELGIRWKSRTDLLESAEIQALIRTKLNEVQKHLAHFEQVKAFKLLPREFCMSRGELTPTMKLRRKVIESTYAAQIQEMYGEKCFN
ncbi:long-chain fatty acid--CoA ligase [Vibrio sp. D431a]|uniref:AMP-dependent synthetase/ligase n=1 Tax=Vibrio sp. D431a TaxID=2837388 RepID=UPI0025545BAD|nr:long-chain fatty acid--CoA ligase [Vibrio sp. D431a]MDK9790705.1 long-chain fatty acid--CoA ligase [Vibrio sp. D431a]